MATGKIGKCIIYERCPKSFAVKGGGILADNEPLIKRIKGAAVVGVRQANQSDKKTQIKVVTKVITIIGCIMDQSIRFILNKVVTKVITIIRQHLKRHNLPSKG